MTFALTLSHLKDSLQASGCPICRMAHRAAEQSMAAFLWENVNDPQVRQTIFASYGFCPQHTQLFVAKELLESATVLGVNILYEHLGRSVAHEVNALKHTKPGLGGWLRSLFGSFGKGKLSASRAPVLPPHALCPVCISSHQAALNALSDLFEEIERGTPDIQDSYLASDGLCLEHLRQGIQAYSRPHPGAADFILEDTVTRLTRQSGQMKEYIRKNNWEYRDEKLTQAESEAWRKTLTFFTGYSGAKFTHNLEEF
jgi:hypothetical protein